MSQSLLEQLASSPLYGANAPYLEALYEQYLRDPQALDASWRQYFDALPGSRAHERDYLRAAAAVPAASQARAIAIMTRWHVPPDRWWG